MTVSYHVRRAITLASIPGVPPNRSLINVGNKLALRSTRAKVRNAPIVDSVTVSYEKSRTGGKREECCGIGSSRRRLSGPIRMTSKKEHLRLLRAAHILRRKLSGRTGSLWARTGNLTANKMPSEHMEREQRLRRESPEDRAAKIPSIRFRAKRHRRQGPAGPAPKGFISFSRRHRTASGMRGGRWSFARPSGRHRSSWCRGLLPSDP